MQRIPRGVVITILLTAVVAIGLWYGLQMYSHRGLVKINVVAVPSDSEISIDGTSGKNGTNYVTPGSHDITASRTLFDPVTVTIDTNKIGDRPIYVLPKANTDAAQQWLYNHPAEQQQRESIVGMLDTEKQQDLAKKYPILAKLPAETSHYKIDYSLGGENNDQVSYTVTLYAIINNPSQYASYKAQLNQYRDEALQFLSNNGVDVNTSSITYTPNDF